MNSLTNQGNRLFIECIISYVFCCFQYYDTEFTLWDRFEVQGEMTLQEFIDYFQVYIFNLKCFS